jgi:membrane protein DedA with SNARE-associated domain
MEVMVDLFESVLEFSYLGIFFLLILVNAAPLLMPPTWIILASFYAIDTSYDPLVLALVGATGATIGRFILKKVSTLFRKFVQKEQKSNLDAIGNFLNKKRFG